MIAWTAFCALHVRSNEGIPLRRAFFFTCCNHQTLNRVIHDTHASLTPGRNVPSSFSIVLFFLSNTSDVYGRTQFNWTHPFTSKHFSTCVLPITVRVRVSVRFIQKRFRNDGAPPPSLLHRSSDIERGIKSISHDKNEGLSLSFQMGAIRTFIFWLLGPSSSPPG